MRVLSLFDGISCGRLALDRAGIPVEAYYASEIDKDAIAVSKSHFPGIIQLGDVNTVLDNLPANIDLILAGSPCQGFSASGRQLGLEDPRSALFYRFLDIREKYPDAYFLLENVRMKKEWSDIITASVGVDPITINSSLVSAQSRVRQYWTNIPGVKPPEDKHIHVVDILEEDVPDSYWLKDEYLLSKSMEWFKPMLRELLDKPNQVTNVLGGTSNTQSGRVYDVLGKSRTLMALGGGLGAKTGLYLVPKILQCYPRGKNNQPGYVVNQVKLPTITNSGWDRNFYLALDHFGIRKFTPIEAERAQTLPDDYTAGFSDSKRYRMVGNAWTVDVVAHILRYIEQ